MSNYASATDVVAFTKVGGRNFGSVTNHPINQPTDEALWTDALMKVPDESRMSAAAMSAAAMSAAAAALSAAMSAAALPQTGVQVQRESWQRHRVSAHSG